MSFFEFDVLHLFSRSAHTAKSLVTMTPKHPLNKKTANKCTCCAHVNAEADVDIHIDVDVDIHIDVDVDVDIHIDVDVDIRNA